MISDARLDEEDLHDMINDFLAQEAPARHISGIHCHEGIDKGIFRKLRSGWCRRALVILQLCCIVFHVRYST